MTDDTRGLVGGALDLSVYGENTGVDIVTLKEVVDGGVEGDIQEDPEDLNERVKGVVRGKVEILNQ